MGALLLGLWRRLRQKVAALLPILIAAGLLFALFSLLLFVVRPYLPAEYRYTLSLLRRGEVAEGRDYLQTILEGYGAGQYALFITLQVGQVLFAPIPGQLVGLLGGYMFGLWRGLALTTVGLALGSTLAFTLGRLFGHSVVRRVVPAAILARFERLINESSLWDFFLIFLLPLFPDDAVCFIAGLTRLPIWQLVLVSIAGRMPWMAVLTYVGAHAEEDAAWTGLVLAVIVVAGLLIWLFSDELEAWMHRMIARATGPSAS
jgi:uncharacterized membrane protein YdjX (TVP38/TMEM64 family)